MNTQDDFEEFLKLLIKNKVKFVLVGGYAVAFHGYVRTTKDMDIFFRNSDDNIHKIINALHDFHVSKVDIFYFVCAFLLHVQT